MEAPLIGDDRLRSTSNDQEAQSISNANHVSLSEAMIAIKRLDRFAFYGTLAEQHHDEPLAKIQRVSDVVDEMESQASSRPSRFSRLTGIGQLHREKARQRKQSRTSMRRTTTLNGLNNTSINNERSSTYRPLSLDMLLERLSTFSISTYSNKPESARLLSPLGMASNGWRHGEGQGRDEIVCVTCTATWKVEVSSRSTTKEEQTSLWIEAEKDVREKHKEWCPWKIRSCTPSLYRAPVRSVLETRADLIKWASKLSSCLGFETIDIVSELKEVTKKDLSSKFPDLPIAALTLAIFGWQVSGEESTPVDRCIVVCSMCARRAGLWTYRKGGKQFDVVREHKSYCPMINGEVQSGNWIDAGRNGLASQSSASLLPAWQLRIQLLLGNKDEQSKDGVAGSNEMSRQFDARSMRSSEILARVNALLEGR